MSVEDAEDARAALREAARARAASRVIVPGAELLRIFVEGIPETKGSWIGYGGGRMKADNPREEAWATCVGWTARAKLRGFVPTALRVGVQLRFHLPPPPNRTKKNRRDIDKLVRSVLDALTKIVYIDDEQVDALQVTKQTGDHHGAEIIVYVIGET